MSKFGESGQNKIEAEKVKQNSGPEEYSLADWLEQTSSKTEIPKDKLEKSLESQEGENNLIDWLEESTTKKTVEVSDQSKSIEAEAAEANLSQTQVQEIKNEAQTINKEVHQAKEELVETLAGSEMKDSVLSLDRRIEDLERQYEDNKNRRKKIVQEVADELQSELLKEEYKYLNEDTKKSLQNFINSAKDLNVGGDKYGVVYDVDFAKPENYISSDIHAKIFNTFQVSPRELSYLKTDSPEVSKTIQASLNDEYEKKKKEWKMEDPNLSPKWKDIVEEVKNNIYERISSYKEMLNKDLSRAEKSERYKEDSKKLSLFSEKFSDRLEEFSNLMVPTRDIGYQIEDLKYVKKKLKDLEKVDSEELEKAYQEAKTELEKWENILTSRQDEEENKNFKQRMKINPNIARNHEQFIKEAQSNIELRKIRMEFTKNLLVQRGKEKTTNDQQE